MPDNANGTDLKRFLFLAVMSAKPAGSPHGNPEASMKIILLRVSATDITAEATALTMGLEECHKQFPISSALQGVQTWKDHKLRVFRMESEELIRQLGWLLGISD